MATAPPLAGLADTVETGHGVREARTSSHDALGNTGKKTSFWLDEFAAPYYVPFLVEDELTALGGKFEKGADWAPYQVTDTHHCRAN